MRREKLGVAPATVQNNRPRYGCNISINKKKDVTDGTKWNDFIDLLELNGFKKSISFDFIIKTQNQVLSEESVLYYNEEGIVIWASSCEDGTLLYDGTIYGEMITLNDPAAVREEMPYCSYDFYEEDKFSFEKSISDGIFQFLHELRQFGEFIPTWQECDKLLWLCNYSEYDIPGFDARKVTSEKLKYADEGLCRIIKNLMP